MLLQQPISLQVNQSYVGKTLDVLVEGFDKGLTIGRSYRDAPEIDGLVFIEGTGGKNKPAPPIGSLVPVRITGAMEYDVVGSVVAEENLGQIPGGVRGEDDARHVARDERQRPKRPNERPRSRGAAFAREVHQASLATGRWITKRVPAPSLSTSTRPSCVSTMRFTIASPTPVPATICPSTTCSAPGTRPKRSKIPRWYASA